MFLQPAPAIGSNRPHNPGRRELIAIAIIVTLGISAAALLIGARVNLQDFGNTLQTYQVACEKISRNINHLISYNSQGQLDPTIASFIMARIRDGVDQADKMAVGVDRQLDQLSKPMTRLLASITEADIAFFRRDNDALRLRTYARSLIASDVGNLPAMLNSMELDLSAAVKYGDSLDDLQHRTDHVSSIALRSSQPLLLLLMTIGLGVLLGILAVWLRALKPAIAELQSKNAELASTGAALTEQNLAYVRREVESLAAQRVAKFGYWIIDSDTGRLSCSEGLAHILGLAADDVPADLRRMAQIGRPSTQFGQTTESDILTGYEELSGTEGAREFTRVIDRPDGEERIIRERVEAFWEPQTGSRYMIGIMIDVSELAHAQARMARADKLDSIAVLAGAIAHDVNNVLAIIRGTIDLLEMRPETMSIRIGVIHQAVANATTLVARLSSIGKSETEDQDLLDLDQVLPATVTLFKANALNTVDVTLDLEGRPGTIVRINRGKLESAILNLLVNASEATDDERDAFIKLSCRIENNPNVDERERRRLFGTFVRLEVSDNGTGMNADVLRRAVDPFFTTKLHHSAMPRGLGLWSVYQTVRSANGGFSIVSKEGQGTTIIMHLPRVDSDDPPAPQDVTSRREPLARASARILIVDDAEELLEVLGEQLRTIGYRTVTASNIASALQTLVNEGGIDVIISDVNLRHGETGLQLATHIRSTYPEKKIVFISGYPTMSQSSGLHADISVVRKPIDIDVLDREIQRLLLG